MRIDWMFLARFAEVPADGTMNVLGAALDTLLFDVRSAPVKSEVYLAVRIVAPMKEWRQPGHVLTTNVIGPNRERRGEWRIPLRETQSPPFLLPDADPGVLLALPHSLTLMTEGMHTIEVIIDDREPERLSIRARDGTTT